TAYPRIMIGTYGIRAYLACKVDYQTGVDRNHVWILSDHGGIVHISSLKKRKFGIIIHLPVQLFRPDGKRSHHLTRMPFLVLVRYSSFFHQINDPVRKHLRMDSQDFMGAQDF